MHSEIFGTILAIRSKEYRAELFDAASGYSLGNELFELATDDEARDCAYQWALTGCQKADRNGRLILVGGSIHGSPRWPCGC
jgi:hypothetical protein